MKLEEIVAKFAGIKKTGSKSYMVKCPCHEDKKASLAISEKDNKILMYCFAECNYENILKEIGLNKKDMFNNIRKGENKMEKIEKEYFYTDEKGNNLYKVVRYFPKNFVQAKYINKHWEYNMNNVRYVLYNLPNILEAKEIYFVEGEKDADNLNSLGLCATTTVGGAKGFNKRATDYIKYLKDKVVYIIQDNDDAGKKYASQIYLALEGITSKVKVLDLTNEVPDLKQKGDISDILQEYGQAKTMEILNNLKTKDYIQNSNIFPIQNVEELNETNFEKMLKFLGIKIQYNVVTKQVEIEGMPERYAKSDLYTILPIYLKGVLRNKGVKLNDTKKVEEFITLEISKNNYNPIIELFDNNKWDENDRYEEICNIFGLEKQFYKTLFIKWLKQAVAMLLNRLERPFGAQGVLVLQGKQEIGKSWGLSLLAIEPEWFADGVVIDMNNKDSIIKATSRWICELGEMDDTLKKEQSALKAFLTSPEDDIRPPYAKKSIRRARNTTFCASVNPVSFLRDSTGNRRFWVIHVNKVDCQRLEQLGKGWILQLWLQVYNEVKKDINCFRLNQEEKEQLRQNNLLFMEFLPYEEELMELIDFNSKLKDRWRNSKLKEKYFPEASSQALGRALNKIEDNYPEAITIKRDGKGTVYLMKLKEKPKSRDSVDNVGNI